MQAVRRLEYLSEPCQQGNEVSGGRGGVKDGFRRKTTGGHRNSTGDSNMKKGGNGNALDRLIGAMKAPVRGGRVVKRDRLFSSSFSSMEIDASLRSRVSARVNSFPSSRKRLNVDMEGSQRDDEDATLVTPPNGLRTPARLRLSVSRKSGESRGNLRDSRDSKTTTFSDYDAALTTTTPESYTNETVLMREDSLTDRRRALFEPLGPALRGPRDADDDGMLPPPDFESASYPQGWVVGKKRKLVNVDVVESMRRIAVHEMNRKDREINGLNEQLEEDSRTMEHLQIQLQQERNKRLQAERENSMLQGQVNMLMNMLDAEGVEEDQDDVVHGHH